MKVVDFYNWGRVIQQDVTPNPQFRVDIVPSKVFRSLEDPRGQKVAAGGGGGEAPASAASNPETY